MNAFQFFISTLDADNNGYLDFKEFMLAVDLVGDAGPLMADQEEMLVGLTGVKLKVSRIRQLQELHLMVRTSLPTATPVESHIPMELPVTVSLLVAVAGAVGVAAPTSRNAKSTRLISPQ